MKLVGRLAQWLLEPPKRRRSPRYAQPGLVAHYWDGDAPSPHEIANISLTGAYMFTTEQWYPGTLVQLTLSRKQADTDPNAPAKFVVVWCEIVRHDRDGVGLRFISHNREARKAVKYFIGDVIAELKRTNAD